MQYLFESTVCDTVFFKKRVVEWLKTFDVFCLLDSNVQRNAKQSIPLKSYDFIVAAGVHKEIKPPRASLDVLDKEINKKKNWLFGFLSYDLKNSFENLSSENIDMISWPDYHFFVPEYLFLLKNKKISILSFKDVGADVLKEILSRDCFREEERQKVQMEPRMSKPEYISKVEQLRRHILRGDIYEVNFCQEFFANAEIDPFNLYNNLNELSPTPFSAFVKTGEKYLVSASPERYLKKEGLNVISQPIKGTAPRGETPFVDETIKQELQKNTKERAENIMIVDLVRNDFSRIAEKNTVRVDELCGVYTFSNVHQMISTVSARLKTQSFKEILKATFPMGSMTGAPKIRAMELAELYETTKRGMYSGAVGYISPNCDFDFNVVIRSLQYNQEKKYLSYMVGGAITWLSDPEKEYEECLLKASAIEQVLRRD